MKYLFLVTGLVLAHFSYAQTDSLKKETVKLLATKMANAFIAGDYETLVKFTYPKVVKAMGGKRKMISRLRSSMEDMASKEVSFRSVSIGSVSRIHTAGKELHCLVEQNIVMTVKGGMLTSKSWLLAVSNSSGKNWFFIDTAPLDNENIQKLFPYFNHELVIPVKERPVFIPVNNN